jgi:diketogulonate reductase-like aldo/keto reductase
MAEKPEERRAEVAALQLGIDLDLSLIDTAETYADGATEELVGEAIAGRRDAVFLVTKLAPYHASRRGTIVACEASLKRLRTDRIDLYLLHGRWRIPLEETLDAFGVLIEQDKIRNWGVSEFGERDMADVLRVDTARSIRSAQMRYSLARRQIERDLLPSCREVGIKMMACSALDEGRLARDRALAEIGLRMDATPAQVALAWVLRQEGIAAVVRAVSPQHLRENAEAREMRLSEEDCAGLDRAFPMPKRKGVRLTAP